jgi:hypothetical protein
VTDEYESDLVPEPMEQGQPLVEPSPVDVGGEEPEAPQYLTAKDLAAFEENLAQKLRDDIRRDLQSLTDKQENRLKKKFEEELNKRRAAYTEIGKEMPPHEEQMIAQRVIDSYSGDAARPAQAGASGDDPVVRFVNNQAQAIWEKAGASVEEASPEENAMLIRAGNDPDPDKYLRVVQKVARQVAERKGTAVPQPPPTAASAPSMGRGMPSGGNNVEKLTLRLAELRRNPFTPEAKEERRRIEEQLARIK